MRQFNRSENVITLDNSFRRYLDIRALILTDDEHSASGNVFLRQQLLVQLFGILSDTDVRGQIKSVPAENAVLLQHGFDGGSGQIHVVGKDDAFARCNDKLHQCDRLGSRYYDTLLDGFFELL